MGFTDLIGCGSNESVSVINLDENQCLIYFVFKYYFFFFGVVGLVVQAYIIFSYNFRRYEPFIPTQLLIMGIAFFDMIACIGLILMFASTSFPNLTPTLSCSFYFTFAAFDENAVYLMVLLMTANRQGLPVTWNFKSAC